MNRNDNAAVGMIQADVPVDGSRAGGLVPSISHGGEADQVRLWVVAPGGVSEPAIAEFDGSSDADSLAACLERQSAEIRDAAMEHGGVLFRGLPGGAVADFRRYARSICPDLEENYADLPILDDESVVYRSTPYPPSATIEFHNEGAHMPFAPSFQFFYCQTPAAVGGETAVTDGRVVLADLPEDITREFDERGIRYIRNFHDGLDVSWRKFFRTDSPQAAVEQCRSVGFEADWTTENVLTVAWRSGFTRSHRATGQAVPFHQILHFHPSLLEHDVRAALIDTFGADALPRDVRYGDGGAIPTDVIERVRVAYHENRAVVAWQPGEMLVIDNQVMAHCRLPYSGERELFVALAEMRPSR